MSIGRRRWNTVSRVALTNLKKKKKKHETEFDGK